LIEWGRIGYVTKRDDIVKKFKDKFKPCVIIGYESDHAGDVYRMYNPVARKIVLSRDITWSDWRRKDPRSDLEPYTTMDAAPGMEEICAAPGMEEICSSSDDEDETPAPAPHIVPNDDDSVVPESVNEAGRTATEPVYEQSLKQGRR
jgi:hypothetical protein